MNLKMRPEILESLSLKQMQYAGYFVSLCRL